MLYDHWKDMEVALGEVEGATDDKNAEKIQEVATLAKPFQPNLDRLFNQRFTMSPFADWAYWSQLF